MVRRRSLLIACTIAAIVQATFIAGYYLITDGCFCATLDSEQISSPPRALLWFVNSADLVHHFGLQIQVGDLPSTLFSAAVNFVAWATILFLLLDVLSRF